MDDATPWADGMTDAHTDEQIPLHVLDAFEDEITFGLDAPAPEYTGTPATGQRTRPSELHDEEPISILDELRATILRGRAILDVPPPEPLIKGWLNLDSFTVLYGRPKSGKSFVALDMALCVATGTRWHGHEVTTGPVLYVVAEGVRGVGPRVDAWAEFNNTPIPDGLIWLPRAVNLLSATHSMALAEIAYETEPALIVIDTLNRSMPGGDENSSKDMGAAIAACDVLRRTTGACVMLVHHAGKNAENGARGHSSLLGAVDTELELKGAEGMIELANTAQKDAASADTLHLGLASAAGSVAVASRPTRGGDEGLSPASQSLLDVLRSIEIPGGISTSVWRTSCEVPERTFYRGSKELRELKKVTNLASDRSPRFIVTGGQYDTTDTQGAMT